MTTAIAEKLQSKEKELFAPTKEFDILYWKPNPGDVLEGEAIEHGETITEYGNAEFLDIASKDKTYRVFLNTVLKRQFEDEDIRKGDHVAIKYIGMVQSTKTRRKYKNYVMVKA